MHNRFVLDFPSSFTCTVIRRRAFTRWVEMETKDLLSQTRMTLHHARGTKIQVRLNLQMCTRSRQVVRLSILQVTLPILEFLAIPPMVDRPSQICPMHRLPFQIPASFLASRRMDRAWSSVARRESPLLVFSSRATMEALPGRLPQYRADSQVSIESFRVLHSQDGTRDVLARRPSWSVRMARRGRLRRALPSSQAFLSPQIKCVKTFLN